VTAPNMHALAQAVGEQTLFNRTGARPRLRGDGPHFFAQHRGAGSDGDLVSLRDHVEAAVHPDRARMRARAWAFMVRTP